jgi:hypothetical protein
VETNNPFIAKSIANHSLPSHSDPPPNRRVFQATPLVLSAICVMSLFHSSSLIKVCPATESDC